MLLFVALLCTTAGHSSSPGSASACDRLVVSFGSARRTDGAPLFGAYELQRSAVYCGQPVWSRAWDGQHGNLTAGGDGFGRGASLFYACTMGSAVQGWVVSERLDTGGGDMLHLLAPLREDAQAPLRKPWAGPGGGEPMHWHASRRVAASLLRATPVATVLPQVHVVCAATAASSAAPPPVDQTVFTNAHPGTPAEAARGCRELHQAIPIHVPVSSATLAEVTFVSRRGENASAAAFAFCDDFIRSSPRHDREGVDAATGLRDGVDVRECAAHLEAEVSLRRGAIDGAHDEAAAGRGGFHRSWALTSLVDALVPHVGSFVESGTYLCGDASYCALFIRRPPSCRCARPLSHPLTRVHSRPSPCFLRCAVQGADARIYGTALPGAQSPLMRAGPRASRCRGVLHEPMD